MTASTAWSMKCGTWEPADDKKNMKCRFCSDIAVAVCRVSVTEPRIALGSELAENDVAQIGAALEFAMIRSIEIQGGGFLMELFGRRHRDRKIHVSASMPYLVLRTEPCETPVCDVHGIDRGDGNSICAYHWEIVEVQAA